MTQLRIHLLRLPGIEAAGKTGKLPLPDTAVQILLRTSIGAPAQGELAAKLTEGSLYAVKCSDLVQKLRLHSCLPLEGKVSAQAGG